MGFTLVAYRESVDQATIDNLAALADPHVRVSGDDIVVPAVYNNLFGVLAFGVSLTRARIVSPSIRALIPLEVRPINRAAEPTSPAPFIDFFARPRALVPAEALNFQGAEDGVGATVMGGLVFLGDAIVAAPAGPILPVRWTGTTTLTAGAWTNGAITFADTLPAGRYAIVGMRVEAAGLVAARLVIPGFPWRPGVIGFDAESDLDPMRFRMGNAGVFGEFAHDAPPTVDYLSESADTSETGTFDVIKIA